MLEQTYIQKKFGFTLIEAFVLLFIFSVITTTFYAVFTTGTTQIIETKNRLGAIAVANEKMEIIRNLEYDAVGTKRLNGDGSYSYGIPGGDILEDESVAVNTKTYSVHSFVQYIDDPLDGKATGTTPIDVVPNDYKRVKVTVSWGVGASTQIVSLVATFVPKGIEVASGGGTLSINVIDGTGSGVPTANVHITNTAVTPHIDITTQTDSTGNLMLPGAVASSQGYRIQASKSGYYSATTYAPYPTTAYNPVDIDASVVDAAFNQKTIVMDTAANLTFTTKDALGTNMPSIGFHLVGGRKLGDTVDVPPVAVPSLDSDFTSDGSAQKNVSDQAAGSYVFSLLDTSQYQLIRLSTLDAIMDTLVAVGGATTNIDVIIADKNIASALVVVTDTATPAVPLAGATVHVTNTLLSYDATVTTDVYGQAYFPTTLPVLTTGTYDYTVSMTGYADYTGTMTIGSSLHNETVTLTAS